jgi:hypothetical protein
VKPPEILGAAREPVRRPSFSMRIAVIGDVHLCWDDRDVELIDAACYERCRIRH